MHTFTYSDLSMRWNEQEKLNFVAKLSVSYTPKHTSIMHNEQTAYRLTCGTVVVLVQKPQRHTHSITALEIFLTKKTK